MKLITIKDLEQLKKQAAQEINSLLLNPSPILLLLSGGSAFDLLEYIDTSLIDDRVTISVLDERYSKDENINNFAQIAKTKFYALAKNKGAHFIDTRIENDESIDELSYRFGNSLFDWNKKFADGIIIATQGMGSDGHTAGIMPYPENPEFLKKVFQDEIKWTFPYDAKEKNKYPLRVTTTITFLKMIDYSIFYVTGEDKKILLKKAINEDIELSAMPAAVIRQMKQVFIFTDQTFES